MKPFAPLLAAALLFSAVAPALADNAVATEIVPEANAPLAMTRCAITGPYFGWNGSMNIMNRTTHGLISYGVEYRFFDQDNTQIGQARYTYTPGEVLEPHDTGSYNGNSIYATLSENATAVSRISCRVTEAHFTGRNNWYPGAVWHGGALAPLPRPAARHDDDTSYENERSPAALGGRASVNAAPVQHLRMEVTNAWNDVSNQGLFVHDTIVVHGADHDSTLRPANLVLTIALANGAKKGYPALGQQAPSYQKYNYLTKSYQTGYQVDPQNDFGRMGSITVPAHGTVTITATFPVSDPVADANANRDVTLQ